MPADHVDHLDPEPLHAQLAAILRRAITSGQYRPRDALPSESQLMEEHGVARGAGRQAIETLGTGRLVVTIRGRGTYVAPK